MDLERRYRSCREELTALGQGHVFQWWTELTPASQDRLLHDVENLDWSVLEPLIATHVKARPAAGEASGIEPARVYPLVSTPDQGELYDEAHRLGRERLSQGKVAAFTVAGGQGTRLGVSGPKGAVVVTPVGGRSLFQLFAETVLAASRRYAVTIPWYVMTSPANHDETTQFFDRHRHFGLRREDVMFFSQGMLPAFDFAGRLLMEDRDRLALAPDGHGGALKALLGSGALKDLTARGVEILSYFQIDNPLVKPFDPLFIGLHARTGSEMSTKVARKAEDLERVGNVCLRGGRLSVVEYTEFPESLARAKNADGSRRFDAGNLAIHLIDTAFIRRVTAEPLRLTYRRADKTIPFVDETGRRVEPKAPNAVKLETFIFDVLPLAENPLVLEVDRSEEFSPVKNMTGPDSLETAKRDQVHRTVRWLEAAGVAVPRRPDGEPDVTMAISPLLALDRADLKERAGRFSALRRGDEIYLE